MFFRFRNSRSAISSVTGVWVALAISISVSAQTVSYPKIEASFNLTGLATDPFDYTVTDVRVQLQLPDASTISLPAFFDGGTTWRVRHTPAAPGLYQITAVTLNGATQAVSNLQPSSWTVGGAAGAGFVRIDPANTNRFVLGNGRRYYPVGHNEAWWPTNTLIPDLFSKFGAAHENWSRVWMTHFYDSLNLEWPKVGSLGQFSLTVAQKWDAIVAAAERNGVYFQMTLQHHGQYSTTTDANWVDNPYNSANGGFLTSATQFFTNTTAKALTKKKYRYIVARWGYSPSILAWELFNEVQFTDAAQNGQWNNIAAWHDEMAQFIRAQDAYHHLVTTSSQLDQPIWNQCDYYQHHDYPNDFIASMRDAPGVPDGQPIKAIFGGEAGRSNTVYYGQHAPLWASVMSAQSGMSQAWYGDKVESERCYDQFRAVRDFALLSGLAGQDGLDKSAPHVTCPQNTSLTFAPGNQGFVAASQDTFTVGDTVPAGIDTLPKYLQGDFHRGMTPNGYTFIVDYPQAAPFSVQVTQIAQSGAGLQISVDSVVVTNRAFPSAGGNYNTNVTLTVNVSAGPHTLNVWNSGLDWLVLGNLTFSSYVPMLGAYQIGNTNFAALWLWHRTNIYRTTVTASLGGTIPVSGLQPGIYSATWWDTFAGAAISNFNFTVVDTNPVSVSTPVISRSVALYAGKAPQAGVIAPSFTLTLGTNSPTTTLPLVLTNSGGLPLSYSLSVTGLAPIVYTALNSSQSDGPTFAWRDASSIGREITNFTALAGPKTAKDEGIAGPFSIGFEFPFFSGAQTVGTFTQLYVSPNGFIAFSPFAGDTSVNPTLPNALSPTNLIALFWDDLDLSAGSGHVYIDSDALGGTCTVQFQNVNLKSSAVTITAEIILKTTGEILLQYSSLGVSNTCTVGVQNATADQGLQAAFNQSYLKSNFAISLTPAAWLGVSINAGLVPQVAADTVSVSLNPAGLSYGTNHATLVLRTGDPLQPLVAFPVSLVLSPRATWRQTFFGTADNSGNAADSADPDSDGLANLLEYAFASNPTVASPPPLSLSSTNGHVALTFQRPRPAPSDLTYWFEVADDLTSGLWSSGPTYTTQNVTDNFDGTETVTVIDNAAPPSPSMHFLRVRISSP
jgi:hypothetical protein